MKPGVFYSQKDLSQVVVGTESIILGIAGNAKWGPVDELTQLDSLDKYVQLFGKPTTPAETTVFYQLLGWFQFGKTCYMVRPQGESKYGGVEALKSAEAVAITASLDSIPSEPSGLNVIGLYSKYPGLHDDGDIYIWIYDVDATAGEFGIQVGIALDTAGTGLDSSDTWFEEHRVSVLTTAKDGYGRSMYIEDVLERDSQLIAGAAQADAAVDDIPIASTSLLALAQMSYTEATESEISLAYDLYEALDAVTIDLLVPGMFTDTIQNKVASIALLRGDTFYILSPDISATWTLEGISGTAGWLAGITTASENGAAYAMLYTVRDEYNDRDVIVPCAGYIAGAYAYNDVNGAKWTAPAGPRRGIQSNVDLYHVWTDSEQSTLYEKKINFVKKTPRYGITVEGQKTLYGGTSALDRVNVARLMLKLRRDLLTFLQDYVYEFNNDRNRTLIKSQIDQYLRDIKSNEGLTDFRTVCSDQNNPSSVIDQNRLYIDVYVQPPKVAEFIFLRTTITASGVDFDSLIVTA